jgi:hypothetical protein
MNIFTDIDGSELSISVSLTPTSVIRSYSNKDGRMHRLGGAALMVGDQPIEYWINGQFFTPIHHAVECAIYMHRIGKGPPLTSSFLASFLLHEEGEDHEEYIFEQLIKINTPRSDINRILINSRNARNLL